MNKNRITILGLLLERPMYGYEIKSEIKSRGMDHWAHISLPSIYTVLNKLEDEALIRVEKEKVGKTPERNIYHITEDGKRELAFQVEKSIVQFKIVDYPLMLGVFFLHGLVNDKAINALKKREETLDNQIMYEKKEIESLKKMNFPNRYIIMINFELQCLKEEKKFIRNLIDDMKDNN